VDARGPEGKLYPRIARMHVVKEESCEDSKGVLKVSSGAQVTARILGVVEGGHPSGWRSGVMGEK
jgi:hypothetical protein